MDTRNVPTATVQDRLRALPSIDEVLSTSPLCALAPLLPHAVLADCARAAVDGARAAILAGEDGESGSGAGGGTGSSAGGSGGADVQALADGAAARALAHLRPSLRRVINATGVIIHTNLGRSPLADAAIAAVDEVMGGYSTLEYDTATQSRGSRHTHVEHLICALTGAEAALCVNNNAAAVMMVLSEFARDREAVVSRGELVEIGGSFRIPDIMALSGAAMVEVGTTNKTHAFDYERAVTDKTAMLLKVHPSNYRMLGFTESVPVNTLRTLADTVNDRRRAPGAPEKTPPVLVYEDQGSGVLIDLDRLGAHGEPTVGSSLAAGADLVSFSGDKLLGGPQAGIIAGRADLIARLKKNPLARALRLDKMTLAALEATLRLYLHPAEALREIPTLRMLTEEAAEVKKRALALAELLADGKVRCAVEVVEEVARAGGGALPMNDIPSWAVRLSYDDDEEAALLETYLVAKHEIPIIGRIHHRSVLLDARTLAEDELEECARAVIAYERDGGAR